LYTYPENFRAYKVLIAAKYSGAAVTVAPNFVFGETNKSAEFLKKFPTGKVIKKSSRLITFLDLTAEGNLNSILN
jgi:hypothetical protein